ncbi:phosphatase PAP2 family protein [Amycolatopsis silviterrae]|uniref:Phosphatase PAP2 family protein n=1 Tax=Amycolatopsis silviterrae TaxID=1656914 RepID=A0ABW5HFQ5_9PSEU
MTARRTLALFAALCALATLVLGLLVAPYAPGTVDQWAANSAATLSPGLLNALVLPTEPYVLIPAVVVIAGICLYRRSRRDALLAVAGPFLAIALNSWALKPAFDRWKGGTLVYPSGHTVSLVAVLTVVVLLVRFKAVAAVVSVVLIVCAAVGMIGLGYHYLTDIAGGVCFAPAVVTALRAALSPRRAPEPSTG